MVGWLPWAYIVRAKHGLHQVAGALVEVYQTPWHQWIRQRDHKLLLVVLVGQGDNGQAAVFRTHLEGLQELIFGERNVHGLETPPAPLTGLNYG